MNIYSSLALPHGMLLSRLKFCLFLALLVEIASTPSVNLPHRARRSNDIRGIDELLPVHRDRRYAGLLSSAADWTRLAHARVGVGEYEKCAWGLLPCLPYSTFPQRCPAQPPYALAEILYAALTMREP